MMRLPFAIMLALMLLPAGAFGLATTPATAASRVGSAREALAPQFDAIDRRTQAHMRRLLNAFRTHRVDASHFAGVNGYGHGDLGRDTLDKVYADVFGADAGLVRLQCFSGTHAIACALFGVLRPGDEMLVASGHPYDTLEEVVGLRDGDRADAGRLGTGSLRDWGVGYREVELAADGTFDIDAVLAALTPSTTLVHVQRSCGYAWRRSLPLSEIARLARALKAVRPDVCLFVDNCYGEFVEVRGPPGA